MDHDLQKIARALAGGCVDSVAKAVFAHSALRERILLKVLDLVKLIVNVQHFAERQVQMALPLFVGYL